MTGHAAGGDISMVDRDRTRTDKGCRRHAMAVIAFIRGRRMGWTLGERDTAGCMTINASARNNLGMINRIGSK